MRDAVGATIAREHELDDELTGQWIGKLARAMGDCRQEILDEWLAARRAA